MLRGKALRLVGATLLALLAAGGPGTGTAQTAAANAADYETPPPGKISAANQRRLTPLIQRTARKYGVETALVHALISAESGYDPKAVSASGAIGLMQLLPITARRYGVEHARDLLDPRVNLSVGTRHLKVLLKKYRNISHALAAYNAGEAALDRQRRRITYIESRKFVVRAIKFYWQYQGSPHHATSGP